MTITRHAIRATTTDLVRGWYPGHEAGYFHRETDPLWADPVSTAGGSSWTSFDANTAYGPVVDDIGRTVMQVTASTTAATRVGIRKPVPGVTGGGTFYRVSAYVSNPTGAPVRASVGLSVNDGTPAIIAGNAGDVITAGPEVEAWAIYRIDGTPTAAWAYLDQIRDTVPSPTATVLRWSDVTVTRVTYRTILDLHPTEATIRMDESWTPYIQATLTCPIPQDDVLDRIDPRRPTRVRVQLSRTSADSRKVRDLMPDAVEVRRNLIPNPSFETGTAGLFASGGAPTSTTTNYRFVSGSYGAHVTFAAAGTPSFWQIVPAAAGRWLAAAVPVYRSTGSQYAALRIIPRDAAGTWLTAESPWSDRVRVGNSWSVISHAVQMPPGTVDALVRIYLYDDAAGAPTVAGTSWFTDGWIASDADTEAAARASVATYFDGDTPSTPGTGDTPAVARTWTGVPHASSSVEWSVPGPHVPPLIGRSTVASWSQTFAGPPPWKVRDLTALLGDPYETPARTDLDASTTFDLQLRAREVDHVAGTMTLELTSDEMSLQDFARFEEITDRFRPPATTSLVTVVRWGLNLLGWDLEADVDDAPIDPGSVDWNLGETLWDFLDAYVRGSDRRLWCDEHRRWRLQQPFTGDAGDPVTIDRPLDVLDRVSRSDGYADSVVAIYTWTETDGTQARTYAYADWTTGQPVTLVHREERRFNDPALQAVFVRGLRERAATRGRAVTVSAVADPAARPGAPLVVAGRGTTVRDAMVSAVAWEYPADIMTIRTRDAST